MVDWTDTDWLLLHDLRLRGLVMSAPDAPIDHLVAAGVVTTKGNFAALTPEGRILHAQWALVASGTAGHDVAKRLYEAFAELNLELLSVCSAWQVTPGGVPNDHRDVAYDWAVIGRLERLHERALPRLRRVETAIPRFGNHATRLRHALRKLVDDGETEWFTSPRIDSYHTVWNQLHEDLLLALGLDRSTEA